jgi:hypothetical protein
MKKLIISRRIWNWVVDIIRIRIRNNEPKSSVANSKVNISANPAANSASVEKKFGPQQNFIGRTIIIPTAYVYVSEKSILNCTVTKDLSVSTCRDNGRKSNFLKTLSLFDTG